MTLAAWTRSTLGELCDLVKGSAQISKTKPGPFPLVTTGEERRTADHFQFDTEAVCVPMISSTGHGHASLKRIHYQAGKFALANLLTALLVKDKSALLPRFLQIYLNYYKDVLIVPLQTGVANMSITVGKLATVPVGFPPLEEQHRIVRTLDEAEALRQLRAQADRRTADLIPALFHEMFGDPATNPMGWPRVPLSRITVIDAPTVDPRLDEYIDLPHVGGDRIESITGKLLPTQTAREDKLISIKYLFDEQYVLYCKIRPYLRKVAMPERRGLCSADIYPVKPVQEFANREYLWAILLSEAFNQYTAALSGRANMPKVNRVQFGAYEAMLPPLSLQREFAARVAKMRALEEQQARSRQRLDELFQSLLHQAFQ